MAKYWSLILLIAVAVLWSSASAKPRYNPAQGDLINAYTKWAIQEFEDVPEPYKSRITTKIEDAKHKHWNNIGEYMQHIQLIMEDSLLELGKNMFRAKRQVSSESEELSESDEVYLKKLYTDILVATAPKMYRSNLRQKFDKALEKQYADSDEFEKEVYHIIEDVSGMDIN